MHVWRFTFCRVSLSWNCWSCWLLHADTLHTSLLSKNLTRHVASHVISQWYGFVLDFTMLMCELLSQVVRKDAGGPMVTKFVVKRSTTSTAAMQKSSVRFRTVSLAFTTLRVFEITNFVCLWRQLYRNCYFSSTNRNYFHFWCASARNPALLTKSQVSA